MKYANQIFNWHKVCDPRDRFSKEEFLDSNATLWEVEIWNEDPLNDKIKIS
jgi:hypothetical protein